MTVRRQYATLTLFLLQQQQLNPIQGRHVTRGAPRLVHIQQLLTARLPFCAALSRGLPPSGQTVEPQLSHRLTRLQNSSSAVSQSRGSSLWRERLSADYATAVLEGRLIPDSKRSLLVLLSGESSQSVGFHFTGKNATELMCVSSATACGREPSAF